jgi:hypothetical protein
MNQKIFVLLLFFYFFHIGGNSKDAEYKLAQSGDATCNGLESAEVDNHTYIID